MDVKWCQHQHEVFQRYFRYALQFWGPLDDPHLSYWIDDTVMPSSPQPMTPELKLVLTRARILSEDCRRESHLVNAVLRHADRSQEFMDIVSEVQWCTSLVYNSITCSNVTDTSAPELKDFPWVAKIGYQEKLFLQIAERKDWEQLLRELVKYRDHHYCTANDCGNNLSSGHGSYCVAREAIRRFIPQEIGGSKVDQKSLLWSFDPEVVKHGRLLGSGAFGAVSEVEWLGFKYAQKTFNAGGLHSLATEAETLVKLNHPHVVRVYAYSEKSLLMDLMSTDLDKFMESRMKGGTRREPFSLAAAMDLMLQIGDAVSYLHSHKVVHRDLKSSNILVNPVKTPGLDEDDGFVFAKIADFGLAKVKRDITRYSHLTHNVGTRRWMAPEIFAANEEDDHPEHAFPMKADVYSFGIICFETLTGQKPFSDEPLSTLYSKLTARIPLRLRLPSSCPTNLASLIYECWDTDPEKRPTFGDVCRVLRYLKGLPTLISLSDPQSNSIDANWPYGRIPTVVKKPRGLLESVYKFGTSRSSTLGPMGDIRGVKFNFGDLQQKVLSGFAIVSNIRGRRVEDWIGEISDYCSEWMYFEENEFLVQVEGKRALRDSISFLNFITTRQVYWSSISSDDDILEDEGDLFRSEPGRVVGFSGISRSSRLWSLAVHTIPNIVECLRQHLGIKE